MSKAIITLTDTEDAQLQVQVEFDPPLSGQDDDDVVPNSAYYALVALEAIREEAGAEPSSFTVTPSEPGQ